MFRRYMKSVGGAVVLTVFLMLPGIAQPQYRPDMQDRRPPRERLEEYKKMKMIEALDLKEEVAVRFYAKYNEHEKAMQSIGGEMMGTVDEIEKLVNSNGPDGEFEKAFKRLHELERKRDEERQRFLEDLHKVLTVQQIGKLVVFERKFGQHLQEAIRDIRKERFRDRE